ncbi:MAG: S8 family peptidase [Thermoprotei archaeon]
MCRSGILALILVVAIMLSITTALAHTPDTTKIRVIVGVKHDYDFAKARAELTKLGTVVNEISQIRAIVLEVPRVAFEHIKNMPFVRYVEEDKIVIAYRGPPITPPGKSGESTTQNYEFDWNEKMINATDVWAEYNSTYGDAAYGYHAVIQVAVVDTGIDYDHPDLEGAVTWCFTTYYTRGKAAFYSIYEGTDVSNCDDKNDHGTHVAGIIAARLNDAGVAGVAPKVVLYAIRVLLPDGTGYVSDVAQGISEAVDGPDNTPGTEDDADVISMSLGGPDSQTLYEAVKYAYSYGVVLVAAAGNEGADQPSYPAAYSEVIAVGAIDQNYQVPDWSNRNPDVVAPGVDVMSTIPDGGYDTMSGTSMACPHVSGTVALIQALRLAAGLSKLTPDEVMQLLRNTAIDLGDPGYDSLYGYGLVDAYAAVKVALGQG